jgi:hypothetical protein
MTVVKELVQEIQEGEETFRSAMGSAIAGFFMNTPGATAPAGGFLDTDDGVIDAVDAFLTVLEITGKKKAVLTYIQVQGL